MITLKTKSKTLFFNIMIIKISQLQNIGKKKVYMLYMRPRYIWFVKKIPKILHKKGTRDKNICQNYPK